MSKRTRIASSLSERYTLYLHLSHATGRGYVGWTTYDTQTRWNWHVSAARGGSHLWFHQAIRKHGETGWEHIDLMTVNDRTSANLLERHFVATFDTYHDGYNMTPGGDGRGRYKHSEETRAKMRRYVKTSKHRQRLSESMKGQRREPLSEEHRRKISESERGEKHYRFGQKLSDDVKQKIADRLKGGVPKNKGVKPTDEQYFCRWGRHRKG